MFVVEIHASSDDTNLRTILEAVKSGLADFDVDAEKVSVHWENKEEEKD